MAKKTLKSFARKQAEEETKEDETVTTLPVGEDDSEEETEGDDEADSEEDEEEAEEVVADKKKKATAAPAKKSASVTLKAGQIAVDATEFKKLQADAGQWNKNKANYATLTDWHKNMKGAGAAGKEDETQTRDKKPSAVASQPWNQKAQAIADKFTS